MTLRWLSDSRTIIREITADLEEVREPWPELDPPSIWYRAKIVSACEPLNAELEIVLIDENCDQLGQVTRFLIVGEKSGYRTLFRVPG